MSKEKILEDLKRDSFNGQITIGDFEKRVKKYAELYAQEKKQGQTLPLDSVSVSHLLITDAPEKIYLNTGFDFVESERCQINFSELSNLTWSDERINDTDIEYSRYRIVYGIVLMCYTRCCEYVKLNT